MKNQNKRLFTIVVITFLLLLIPLIAMQFTNEVNWKIFDFIIAGTLIFGSGLGIEIILRKVKSKQNRRLFILILLIILVLIWAELAVGLFGTPFAGS